MGTVRTAIPGLDELIEGGYIENDIILVTGGPGAGKTTFGIQYLVGGVMDFNDTKFTKTLENSSLCMIAASKNIGDIFMQVQTAVEEIKAKRLHILRAGGSRIRAIEILKMRGVKHDDSLHPYEIQEKGIIVHPTETVMSDAASLFDAAGIK